MPKVTAIFRRALSGEYQTWTFSATMEKSLPEDATMEQMGSEYNILLKYCRDLVIFNIRTEAQQDLELSRVIQIKEQTLGGALWP